MKKAYKFAAVFIWALALAMATNAVLSPGSLPSEAWCRIGLALITAAFAAHAIYAFLWGSVKGHCAKFAVILLFYSFCAGMHTTVAAPGEAVLLVVKIAMIVVPLIGLVIALRFRRNSTKGPSRELTISRPTLARPKGEVEVIVPASTLVTHP